MTLKWGEVKWGEVEWGTRKWSGEGYLLDIYRDEALLGSLRIDEGTRLIRQLLGEDIIKSTLKVPDIIDIQIGDYTVWEGIRYYVNALPNIKKNSTNSFDYDITFESEYYELLKTQFLDLDENSDFYLVGNLETFIDLIVTNINREHTGWAKGTWDKTSDGEDWASAAEYKLLSFSKANCMQVLQNLCGEFEGEFYFEGKNICFTDKAGSDSGLTFKYKQGLRNITRQTLSEKNIITRLYAFGSRKNLKSNYRYYSRRLKFELDTGEFYLEKYITATTWEATTSYILGDIVKSLTPNNYYYECTEAGDSGGEEPTWGTTEGGTTEDGTVVWTCRVDPTDKYGVIEHTEIFEEIYPHRTGEVTDGSEVTGDILKFRDSGMFNLKDDGEGGDYLLPGITAKVHFNSGDLGGYEFEISNYDHGNHEFTIIAFKDERGYEMPNADFRPKSGEDGDKYVLIDIRMPQSYIDTAEIALKAKAQTYLNNNCEPRVTYLLEPDWRHFKAESIALNLGDSITIEDTDLNINSSVRIVELTRVLINAYKYTLKLSDHLETQLIQRLYSEQEGIKGKIEIGDVGDITRARRNWRTSEELRTMVFDTDGYFDMGNIRSASIETSMLSVGAESTQFILKEVQIEANYTGDKSKFHASAGELIHLSIAEEIRTWILDENTETELVDETAYYIYAECRKLIPYTGQIVVDEEQKIFDDDETYYYFLIGVLHSVVDGVREVSLTYGHTIINGKFIGTGKIESTDGKVYFDLDGNALVMNKESYASEVAGLWLGYDVDKYKIYIGNATNYFKWDGSALTIKGRLNIGAGTNEDIYFEDSEIRMYDYLSGNNKGIGYKHSTVGFSFLTYNPITDVTAYTISGDGVNEWCRIVNAVGDHYSYFEGHYRQADTGYKVRLILKPTLANADFYLFGTGQLQLPNLASDPIVNNQIGQICMVVGHLKYWNGTSWVLV